MRRILYVTDSLMAGGIESQLVDLVTRLDRTLYEPYVLCLYGPTARDLHFAAQLEAAGVRVRALDLGWSVSDKLRAVREIVAFVRAFRPQLVQAENYHSNLLTRVASPCFPRRTQLIGTIRGVLTSKQLRYERVSSPLYAHMVASAPFLKDLLVTGAGVPARKIAVVPNAVDVERFATSRRSDVRAAIAPSTRRVLVSVGRISTQKTMHLIPQALGLLKRQHRLPDDVRVFIVGPVQDAPMQALLTEAIKRDALEAVVVQREATQTPEDYYHASDASILFSTLEGLPIVALESLAAGRPVVISAEANAAEVIQDGVTGWVVPTGNIERLAETLHAVLTCPETDLERMRSGCRERAQQYSFDALVRRYTALYDAWTTGAPEQQDAS